MLSYSGKASCDTDSVFALETKKRGSNEFLLPIDRVVGENADAPLAVLYTDLTDPKFGLFHQHLYSSAEAGKIRYVVRYKPAPGTELQELTGFGAELYIKRTDYLVIDDRDQGNSAEEELKVEAVAEESEVDSEAEDKDEDEDDSDEEEDEDEDNSVLTPDTEGATISKGALNTIGFKAAGYILESENPFEALVNVSLDFPKYSNSISKFAPDRVAFQELQQVGVKGGSNGLYINGAKIDSIKDDIFSVAKAIDRERNIMEKFRSHGISPMVALNLIMNESEESGETPAVKRYDYRSPAVTWLNDMTKDSRYEKWTSKVGTYLRQSQQLLSPVRHNTHSIVFAFDLANSAHYVKLPDLFALISRSSPIQIGILPLITSPESEEIAKEFFSIAQDQGGEIAMAYLAGLVDSQEHGYMFDGLKGKRVSLLSEQVNIMVSEAKKIQKRLDLELSEPTLFTNGIMTPLTQRWFYEISDIVRNDNVVVRQFVEDGKVANGIQLKDLLLEGALISRNSLISPTDKSSLAFYDVSSLYNSNLQFRVFATSDGDLPLTTIWVVGEPTPQFLKQVVAAMDFLDTSSVKARVNIVPFLKPDTDIQALIDELITKKGEYYVGVFSMLASEDFFHKELADLEGPEDFNVEMLVKNYDILGSIDSLTILHGGRAIALGDRVFSTEDLIALQKSDYSERIKAVLDAAIANNVNFEREDPVEEFELVDKLVSLTISAKYAYEEKNPFFTSAVPVRQDTSNLPFKHNIFTFGGDAAASPLHVTAILDPLCEKGQVYVGLLQTLFKLPGVHAKVILAPQPRTNDIPLKRFYRTNYPHKPTFDDNGKLLLNNLTFSGIPQSTLLNMDIVVPSAWVALPEKSSHDLENIILDKIPTQSLDAGYALKHLLLEGHAIDTTFNMAPRGMALEMGALNSKDIVDTSVMANLGYFQLKANPGLWELNLKEGRSQEVYKLDTFGLLTNKLDNPNYVFITEMTGLTLYPKFTRQPGAETQDVLESADYGTLKGVFKNTWNKWFAPSTPTKQADINIFTVASGHLYERFLSIMTISVMQHTDHTVKFWLIENFLSPSFKKFLPHLAAKYGFEYELVSYKWPSWLRPQTEKQRTIWGYKILFLDVLFPQNLDKVIFVDADQIVRTDMMDLNEIDLEGAPYGFTPMCDSREEIEGFRFWKQGYWKNYLGPLKYHISALYVVDLKQFRKLAAGDQLRQHYQMLSADPGSLSNLDQDLPNHLQKQLPIYSLPQDWLWCETWCSDESLKTARTIDLCNNPMTKEPKLDRAKRQVPEWVIYDAFVSELRKQAETDEAEKEKEKIAEEVVEPVKEQVETVKEQDIYDEL